jgi:RHS repeat-associated protein
MRQRDTVIEERKMTAMNRLHGVLMLIALLMLPGLALAQTEDVRYYHQDAVGSVRVVTDANGQIVERYDYLPFGEPWTAAPTGTETRRFGGKERDGETAFDYFGARYYASQSGRFTTVDPVVDIERALVEPQLWNRYAYVVNNPFRYVDPDGRDPRNLLRAAVLAADVAAPFTAGSSLTIAAAATAALASYEMYDHRREIGVALLQLGTATSSAMHGAWDSLTQASRKDPYAVPEGFPALDRTGKAHGDLPQVIPEKWARETLEEAAKNLRESINNRKGEQKRRGEDGPHRRRIQEEEDLLRRLEKELSGS